MLLTFLRVSQVRDKISMAAGSVAAGGLYMQTELTSMANKKLQNLGVQVEAPDQYRRPLVRKNPSKQVLPKMWVYYTRWYFAPFYVYLTLWLAGFN